ncbi:MAG: diguanylate cyclase [Pseudomonadota bacterium]
MNIFTLTSTCARDEVVCIPPDASCRETASKLKQSDIGALLVTDSDANVVGMVSERDIVRAYAEMGPVIDARRVADLMTPDVIVCSGEDDVLDVLEVLHRKHIRHIPVVEGGKAIAMLSIRDFEYACKELQLQAFTDPLTGLPNRRAFYETFEKELARHDRFGVPLSVALADIDHFKLVNDRYGHAAGDEVLAKFAHVLTREFRSFDGIGRIGGEEFALLFPHTRLAEASLACQRIMTSIANTPIMTDAGEISVSVSIGLTEVGPAEHDRDQILKRADELLYAAKTSGRNCLRIDSDDASEDLRASAMRSAPETPHHIR